MRFACLILLVSILASCDKAETIPTEPLPTKSEKEPEVRAADPASVRPPSFADLVEKTRPSVINIYTKKRVRTDRYIVNPKRGLVPEQRLSESLGSGFIISADGLALTNYHVIEKASDVEVRLLDERRFPAKVVGVDPKTDLALLEIITEEKLPALRLADSESLRVGDWVVAIGNPLGLTSTVTAGIASAVGRKSLPLGGDLRFQDFIQTDASINPGNSGGPLFNLDGEVVGINTAINREGQGLGFAIPINMVKEILPRLKEGGRVQRSWLGVFVDKIPKGLRTQLSLPENRGVLVRKVVKGGPAADAGLRPGDIVLKLNDKEVSDPNSLAWLAGNLGVGVTVPIHIQRGTAEKSLEIKMGILPD